MHNEGKIMSENYEDDDFDSNEEDNSIPNLRKAASRSKKLEAENQALKRQIAFSKAGISLDDPKMKYFIKGYEGDMESDNIKAAAIEAGFLVQREPVTDTRSHSEGQQRVMAASAGAIPEDVTEEAALSRMEAAMEEGGMEAFLDVVQQYGIPTSIEQ